MSSPRSTAEAQDITHPKLPPELCRFRSFAARHAGGNDEQTVCDLLRGRLHFADITSFNDPFEARPRYVQAFTNAGKQRAAIIEYLTDVLPGTESKTQKRKTAEKIVSGKTMEELIAVADQRILARAGELFVLCLMAPETIATPLPWAHYADGHRGVCIHFDTTKRPLSVTFPVEYSDEYPELVVPRTHRAPFDIFRMLLLRKSDAWAYEKEYRVIQYTAKQAPPLSRTLMVQWDGHTALGSSDIARSITLGYRMEPETRTRLVAWIKVNTPHVEIWQADLHRHRYEIVRSRIS